MSGFDILTDNTVGSNHDIILSDTGEWTFCSTLQELVTQKIQLRLNCWLGEWSYNEDFGTPYKTKIFVAGLTKEEVDAEIITVINEIDEIDYITGLESSLDRYNRIYTIDYLSVYVADQSIEIPTIAVGNSGATNEYPEPYSFEDFTICSDTDDSDDAYSTTNEYYYLVNYRMADTNAYTGEVGDSTWWNQWSDGVE